MVLDPEMGETGWAGFVRALEGGPPGKTIQELAAEVSVSERQARRYVARARSSVLPSPLRTTGAGHNRDPIRYYARAGSSSDSVLQLSESETLALELARRMMDPLTGTHLADAFDSVLAKIRRLVPKATLAGLNVADMRIHVRRPGHTDYVAVAEVIRVLEKSIIHHQRLDLEYQPPGYPEPFSTTFDPYTFVYHADELYVLGMVGYAEERRLFKAVRIHSACPNGESFELPLDFDLQEEFAGSFGVFLADGVTKRTWVRVRFRGRSAQELEEHRYHSSQMNEPSQEEPVLFDVGAAGPGAIVATFRLANVIEFKQWIKSFGDEAEVLDPAWLRADIQHELLTVAQVYASPD